MYCCQKCGMAYQVLRLRCGHSQVYCPACKHITVISVSNQTTNTTTKRLQQATERDALARLEAWRKNCVCKWAYAFFGNAENYWWVRLQDDSLAIHVSGTNRPEGEPDGSTTEGGRPIRPWRFWIGTNEAPASLSAVIHAALDEWERRYGEKEEV